MCTESHSLVISGSRSVLGEAANGRRLAEAGAGARWSAPVALAGVACARVAKPLAADVTKLGLDGETERHARTDLNIDAVATVRGEVGRSISRAAVRGRAELPDEALDLEAVDLQKQ